MPPRLVLAIAISRTDSAIKFEPDALEPFDECPAQNTLEGIRLPAEDDCAVCLEPMIQAELEVELPCKHIYHRACITALRKRGVNELCPLCRAPLPPGPEELHEKAVRLLVRAQMTTERMMRQKLGLEAELLLRQVLCDEPEDAEVHMDLGAVLEHNEDIDGSIVSYRRAIELDHEVCISLRPRKSKIIPSQKGPMHVCCYAPTHLSPPFSHSPSTIQQQQHTLLCFNSTWLRISTLAVPLMTVVMWREP
jgi:hypothetical protein